MSGVPFTSFPVQSRGSSHQCSGCFCNVGSGSPSLLPHASVGAAVFPTFVAITGLLALWLECWRGVVSQWSQQLQEFAERQRRECAPMPWCGTSTSSRWTDRMAGNWRWWLMVCRSSTGHNWRSIPPLCRRCEQTGLFAQAAMPTMAQPFVWPEESKRGVFLRQLAKAKARAEPVPLQAQARAAWLHRWRTILACCSARSFGMSLLEIRGGLGSDSPTPTTTEVMGEFREVWAAARGGRRCSHA